MLLGCDECCMWKRSRPDERKHTFPMDIYVNEGWRWWNIGDDDG